MNQLANKEQVLMDFGRNPFSASTEELELMVGCLTTSIGSDLSLVILSSW